MKIIKYTHKVLTGSDCIIEESFQTILNVLCGYAAICNLKLFITSSHRTSTYVPGAIVTPAMMSNHLVGHAIDCNIEDGKSFWNSKLLAGTLSGNVKDFIEKVQADKILRWGGDFHTRDVVHFDDGLNITNADIWHQLFNSQTNPTC